MTTVASSFPLRQNQTPALHVNKHHLLQGNLCNDEPLFYGQVSGLLMTAVLTAVLLGLQKQSCGQITRKGEGKTPGSG